MSRIYEVEKGEKETEVKVTVILQKSHIFTLEQLKKNRENLQQSRIEANKRWKAVLEKIDFELSEIDDYISKAIAAGVKEKNLEEVKT